MCMRGSQAVRSAIGSTICVLALGARGAEAQERGRAAATAGEDRQEVRRRAAEERRAALLEWHRARRAGLDPRMVAAPRTGYAARAAPIAPPAGAQAASLVPALAPAMRTAAAGRGTAGGIEPLETWGAPWTGPAGRLDSWRVPGAAFGSPFAFDELVCVARIRDARGFGSRGFERPGRGYDGSWLPRFGRGADIVEL